MVGFLRPHNVFRDFGGGGVVSEILNLSTFQDDFSNFFLKIPTFIKRPITFRKCNLNWASYSREGGWREKKRSNVKLKNVSLILLK